LPSSLGTGLPFAFSCSVCPPVSVLGTAAAGASGPFSGPPPGAWVGGAPGRRDSRPDGERPFRRKGRLRHRCAHRLFPPPARGRPATASSAGDAAAPSDVGVSPPYWPSAFPPSGGSALLRRKQTPAAAAASAAAARGAGDFRSPKGFKAFRASETSDGPGCDGDRVNAAFPPKAAATAKALKILKALKAFFRCRSGAGCRRPPLCPPERDRGLGPLQRRRRFLRPRPSAEPATPVLRVRLSRGCLPEPRKPWA